MASKGDTVILKCASTGPRNNNLIKKCAFIEKFPDTGYSYSCPICNGPMKRKKQR
jgi:hypothetical protein